MYSAYVTNEKRIPELLAPAGSPACLPAAVAGGADAVYLGLSRFSARARAENFSIDELQAHIRYLHYHGLRCYVTLNTLLRDRELPAAVALAERVAGAGVDAVILQDLGLWRILRREIPELELHASTQMTVHSPEQISALAALGARRIIMARELRLDELVRCTERARAHDVETECFVHGALCYSFSGQCLISAMATGRSANRGACEQNCRFDYHGLGQHGAALSLCDLNLLERVPELASAGIASLKIEGRLKGPEYVYTVCRAYRAALDAWAAGRVFDSRGWQDQLRQVFARPFTAGLLDGDYGENTRESRNSKQPPDAWLVQVSRTESTAVLRSEKEIKAGQGFRYTLQGGGEGGFLVTYAERDQSDTWRCKIRLPRGLHLPTGLALYQNADQQRSSEAKRKMAEVQLPSPQQQSMGLEVRVVARIGRALQLFATASDGRHASVRGVVVESARAQALNTELLQRTVGAMGGSGYEVASWKLELDQHAFVPASALKRLRRELLAAIGEQAIPVVETWCLPEPAIRSFPPSLHVAVGSIAAAHAAFEAGADKIWLDDPKLDMWQENPPRMKELPPFLWLRHPAAAPLSPHLAALGRPVVAGHLGVVQAAREAGLEVIADLGLNVSNHATADALAEIGATAAVVSLELKEGQIEDLILRTRLPCLAVVLGRPLEMCSRQDHGLKVGERRLIEAEHKKRRYTIERHVANLTMIRGAKELNRMAEAAALLPKLGGFVLDLASTPEDQITDIVRRARSMIELAST